MDRYDAWLADFRRRLAQHDAGVACLARDIASRTSWSVTAVRSSPEFAAPPVTAGQPPDVLCRVGGESPSLCFEVELPETLVRRATIERLRELAAHRSIEPRVVLVVPPDEHERHISQARRMLHRAGLPVEVVAIAPDEKAITGADW
ncbi:MAG: hypothetical protein AB7V42_03630 [Thermoleophilia bacterium]